jgi:CheY-like chemotaxis protein
LKTVLLVEDSSDDAFFMKMACQRAGIPHSFQLVTDGEAAIDYLNGNGIYSDRVAYPLPDLVFLDLHMPKRNGHQVLEWIRDRKELAAIPVVMLTSSTEPTDISRAYCLGVTSYLQKLTCPAEFGQAVRVILKYWLELNMTP